MCWTATTRASRTDSRLTDDVIDIALQVVEGELVDAPNDLGDAVNKNDKKFGKSFPYVGLPTAGSRGKTVQGNTTNSVRSAIGTGVESGTDDTTLIAASADMALPVSCSSARVCCGGAVGTTAPTTRPPRPGPSPWGPVTETGAARSYPSPTARAAPHRHDHRTRQGC